MGRAPFWYISQDDQFADDVLPDFFFGGSVPCQASDPQNEKRSMISGPEKHFVRSHGESIRKSVEDSKIQPPDLKLMELRWAHTRDPAG